MHLLQRVPTSIAHDSEAELLYRRTNSAATTYDTFFGAFAAKHWADSTAVNYVALRIEVTGNGRANLMRLDGDTSTVVESLEFLHDDELWFAGVDISTKPPDGLFLSIEGGALQSAEWLTDEAPLREVRIDVVITTFNRQNYVDKTIDALEKLSRDLPSVGSCFRVHIIDNAGTFDFSQRQSLGEFLTITKSPNLGGAGGFTRGLMESRERGWATHVLFMDDDVTIEPESIVRTISFLSFAKDANCCVHGAMISEEQPWICVEAGADYIWKSIYPPRPLHHLKDLRNVQVAISAVPSSQFAYSAWWYTAFPINLTRDNPLPVFIRGDDVAWGLMHTRGHIKTLPGVAVWHADFDVKNVPAAVYYEIRNLTLANLLTFEKYRSQHLLKRFLGYAFLNLYSMRYLSVEYLLRGMSDFFAGPDNWMTLDHEQIHKDLYSSKEETSQQLSSELVDVPFDAASMGPTSKKDFMLSLLTFGGTLIPSYFRSRDLVSVPVQKRAIGATIRHNIVVHRHPRQPLGFVAERDSKRFWLLLFKVARMAIRIPFTYRRVSKKYKNAYPTMVSDAQWKKNFKIS